MTHQAHQMKTGDRLSLPRLLANETLTVSQRVGRFADHLQRELEEDLIVARAIVSPMDRQVLVGESGGGTRAMLMFGSNNYLGFANDPYVLARVKEDLSRYGAGLGGPPLLNGTTGLHALLEERVSRLKGKPAALLYSSGYCANLGWLTALCRRRDVVVLDELCHASLFDGARAAKATVMTFRHNSVGDLEQVLAQAGARAPVNLFVVVESVYGMDGDLAPLDEMVPLAREAGAFIALDDAHGTGVLGPNGGGGAEMFGLEQDIDLVMGTFSKALAASGAFVAADRQVVDYLRFFSHSYFFSASMPPVAISLIHAGLDLLERQPQRRRRLHDNVRYLIASLQAVGVSASSQSAVVPVYVPGSIRRMAKRMHDAGIFVNAIEFPAVARGKERFRVSVMSEHTHQDIDRLVSALDEAFFAEGFARAQRRVQG